MIMKKCLLFAVGCQTAFKIDPLSASIFDPTQTKKGIENDCLKFL